MQIKALRHTPETVDSLTTLLIEVVANGGSVSFMHPLDPAMARNFWQNTLISADRGERIILGAIEDGQVIGTVSLLLDCPPNQPHRAEVAKMMTRVAHRGKGVATALMHELERLAILQGKTMLVLDTATEDGAAPLYERLGFNLTGEIPDYALKPHGGLTGTLIYWKRIG